MLACVVLMFIFTTCYEQGTCRWDAGGCVALCFEGLEGVTGCIRDHNCNKDVLELVAKVPCPEKAAKTQVVQLMQEMTHMHTQSAAAAAVTSASRCWKAGRWGGAMSTVRLPKQANPQQHHDN
jgi:hypothetical protein